MVGFSTSRVNARLYRLGVVCAMSVATSPLLTLPALATSELTSESTSEEVATGPEKPAMSLLSASGGALGDALGAENTGQSPWIAHGTYAEYASTLMRAMPTRTEPETSTCPDVVGRLEWDEAPPDLSNQPHHEEPLWNTLRWIIVHHTTFTEPATPQYLKEYHQQVSKFADVGYHFMIGVDGTIYETRDIHVVGAHAGRIDPPRWAYTIENGRKVLDPRVDPDYGAIGIVLDGNFVAAHPTAAQQKSLLELISSLRAEYFIDVEHVIGHRDVMTQIVEPRGLRLAQGGTECPGDGLYEDLDTVRAFQKAQDEETERYFWQQQIENTTYDDSIPEPCPDCCC